MTRSIATVRALMAALIVVAVTATYLDTASREVVNPLNFFGFFTMQGNLIAAIALAIAAIAGFAGRASWPLLDLLRAVATTNMIIVGLVYNILLTGIAGGVELPWANSVLHIWAPLYLVVDWVLVGDRRAVPWRRFWVVLVYPLVWVAVVLARGATDGWVPYPFLDPATGYGSVAVYVLVIALAFGLFGAMVWALSRVRVLVPAPVAIRG
ncbi:Pr6Pr family membrane protein [Marisediminicola senii]|uniref:Pr6Pr family membrane protein n=1 Tax=Marisediminicola senii TaxID=2711233 RepID=UPI0013EDE816|nr:Pr6Pr family membrane protein [Marisediminicola senii]